MNCRNCRSKQPRRSHTHNSDRSCETGRLAGKTFLTTPTGVVRQNMQTRLTNCNPEQLTNNPSHNCGRSCETGRSADKAPSYNYGRRCETENAETSANCRSKQFTRSNSHNVGRSCEKRHLAGNAFLTTPSGIVRRAGWQDNPFSQLRL